MKTLPLIVAFACLSTPLAASEEAYLAYVRENAPALLSSPVVQAAVRDSNTAHALISDSDIGALDGQWEAQLGAPEQPLIASIVSNAASERLRSFITETGETVAEVILMDNRGLNAAASAPTSDFWQGDEDKFQKTFLVGPNAAHVSDVELDESTGIYVVQVSVPVVDATGGLIGAATFSLDAERF